MLSRCTILRSFLAGMLSGLCAITHAETPTFDQFYEGVSECRLDFSRYANIPFDPTAEAVLISLPTAGAVRGFLITTFYFSPGGVGKAERYGLVFNGALDDIAHAFPEFVGNETINGHLRRLLRLSDASYQASDRRQTLLVCAGGIET
jgi:hypothetical protein